MYNLLFDNIFECRKKEYFMKHKFYFTAHNFSYIKSRNIKLCLPSISFLAGYLSLITDQKGIFEREKIIFRCSEDPRVDCTTRKGLVRAPHRG